MGGLWKGRGELDKQDGARRSPQSATTSRTSELLVRALDSYLCESETRRACFTAQRWLLGVESGGAGELRRTGWETLVAVAFAPAHARAGSVAKSVRSSSSLEVVCSLRRWSWLRGGDARLCFCVHPGLHGSGGRMGRPCMYSSYA